MKALIKIISAVLCISLLLSACAKGGTTSLENGTDPSGQGVTAQPENIKSGSGTIELPYNPTDGINPFFAKSNENKLLFSLIYKPLFRLSDTYEPTAVIADSIITNGNIVTVQIKSGISCRGSSNITASDVVYSFNLAKASYLYSGQLLGISSASAKSGTAVDFITENPDIFLSGKLTFPIVKEGTADLQTSAPTGSGDWYFYENQLISVADSNKTIALCNISTTESAKNAFKIGLSDYFFSDLHDCNYTGVIGPAQEISLNSMVFIGINSKNGALNKNIRSAIATGLNCEDIALSSYEGHAAAAKLPFNPLSYFGEGITPPSLSGDKALAEKIIDKNGYTRYSGTAKTNGAYSLSFSLIVNSSNRYRLAAAYNIADSLADLDIKITVVPLSDEEYTARVAAGNYDLYLGEIKLDGSMDIAQFFKEGTPFSSGIDLTERAAAEYIRYRGGELSAAEYYKIFTEFYPFIPVCFRNGYAMASADLSIELLQIYNIK